MPFVACHYSCYECKGPGPNDCKVCRHGYKQEQDGEDESAIKCVDVNECDATPDICPAGKYCANTQGSHSCLGRLLQGRSKIDNKTLTLIIDYSSTPNDSHTYYCIMQLLSLAKCQNFDSDSPNLLSNL